MTGSPAYTIVEVIAALGILIPILGAVIVNIIVALRTHKAVGVVDTQIKEVHSAVNSNFSAAKSELAIESTKNAGLVTQIDELKSMVQDLKHERERAAIATATALPAPPLEQ